MMASWEAGNFDQAVAIADALLLRDPRDYLPNQMRARAALSANDFNTATFYARRAWRVASSNVQRFEAARVMANTLFRQGRITSAQLWLRRTLQLAPTPELRDRTAQEFEAVREANPLRMDFRFSARRSDNVNNGAEPGEFTISFFGIPLELPITGSALALSGRELTYGATIERRMKLQRGVRTFYARFDGRDVVLSPAAMEMAPDAENSDYALRELTFGTSSVETNAQGQLRTDISIERSWYGGEPLANEAAVRWAYTPRPRSRTLAFTYRTGLSHSFRLDNDARSGSTLSAGLGIAQRVSHGDFSYDLEVTNTISDSSTVDRARLNLGIGYSPRELVYGTELTTRLTLSHTDFHKPFGGFGTDRQDVSARASMSLQLLELDYFGFSPVVDLTAERTTSTISLYETRSIGLSIGIKSSF
ncbi:MAG: hypothetical protein AAFR50_06100 [Pseudomonadota bacterium]